MKNKQKLRVLELASVLAGPSVGMFLAELGAEVIKIEALQGDVTRTWRLPSEPKEGPSGYYASINWGKKVWHRDLRLPEVQAEIQALMPEIDIVLANFKPGSAEKLGLHYEALQALNPRLIYASLSGFGPDDSRPAFDVVVQAEAGFMYMNGEAEGPATKMPVALMDVLAAHQLKEGILYALWQRESTGRGGLVEVSLLASGLAALVNQATNWLMGGQIPQRMGSLHPNIAPYGEVFRTQDGIDLVLAIGNDAQFAALCRLLHLDLRPEWQHNGLRLQHRKALQAALSEAFAKVEAAAFLEACHAQAVPLGQVRDMASVMQLPQAQALMLEEKQDGKPTRRLASKAFSYRPFED